MNAERLLAHYERIADAPEAVPRLRRFILSLAVRGKLVEQDPNDEPAAELLKRIGVEKARLVKAELIKRPKQLEAVERDDTEFCIPSSWCWTRLGEVTSYIQRGKSPKYASADGFPVVSQKCVQWHGLDLDKVRKITYQSLVTYEDIRFLREGDLLWNSTGTGTIGRIIRLIDPPERLVCDSHVTVVRCLFVSSEYIRTWLRTGNVYGLIEERAAGSTNQVELTAQMALNQVVPLPPLAEQHRIVAKVDELMALCDRLEVSRTQREKTRDRLEGAVLSRLNAPDPDPAIFRNHAGFALENLAPLTTRSDQIKALRQTILSLAVRGKLVEQDPNDEPAAELVKRIAAEKARLVKARKIKKASLESPIFPNNTPFSLPTGWAWSTLGWICSKTGSGSTPRGGKKAYKPSGVVFLRSQNVHDYGLRLSDAVYIDRATHERMSGTAIETSDLLLNITGGSIGRCCLVPDGLGEANISQHVAIIRTAINGPQHFMRCVVLSPYFQDFISNEQTGAGRGGLPKNKMDRIPVPLPPLAEQHRIVAKVDGLMALCDRLEAALATSNDNRLCLLDALLNEVLPARRLRGHLTKRKKLVH